MGANAANSIEPKAHHFVSQEGGGHLDRLGHHRTPQRETLWRKAGQIFAFAKNDARGRTQLAAHKPCKRRLPCSVGSDEAWSCAQPRHQRSDCERIIRRRSFGRSPVGRRTSTRAGGFCRWLRSGTEWTEERRRRSAAWTARRCATGSIASTRSGPEGLIDNWTEGPKPRLSAEQLAQFAQIVEAGPDREKDGVVRWRRIDLKRVIAERFGVDFHPRYVGKLLKKLGFSHISARPRHPAQDERIVEAFKKTSRAR